MLLEMRPSQELYLVRHLGDPCSGKLLACLDKYGMIPPRLFRRHTFFLRSWLLKLVASDGVSKHQFGYFPSNGHHRNEKAMCRCQEPVRIRR